MYIPAPFRNENREDLLAFLQAHPFALVCSNGETVPFATHLPFTFREEGEQLSLVAHFAAGNPHAHVLKAGAPLLVIFSGPNAYVSPSHYEKKENVPTWNYIAVHAHGNFQPLLTEAEKEKVLLATIERFEPGYKKQWDSLSAEYISGMLKGILAFEIEVTKLEGKFKLSQNKTKNEQEKIAAALAAEKELSGQIRKNLDAKK